MHATLAFTALATLSLTAQGVLATGVEKRTYTTEEGQYGYNGCEGMDGQSSLCQTVVMNNLNDFCLWGPPTPGTIGDTERYEVAWCTQAGHGTRVIPAGTISSAHWVETPNYIQVTGVGNFQKMNIVAGDEGGELDPHGADGNGNPIGAQVFSNGVQIAEWTSFISYNQFCFRFCKAASDAWQYCQHIYDIQGCAWNEPGDYGPGFDSCNGDSAGKPGIYVNGGVTSTYYQGPEGHPIAPPPAHPAGATSNCQHLASLGGGGLVAQPQPTTPAVTVSTQAAPASSAAPTPAVSSAAPSSDSVVSSESSSSSSSVLSSSSVVSSAASSSGSSSSFVTSAATSTTAALLASRSSSSSAAPSPTAASVKAASAGTLRMGAVGTALALVAGVAFLA